MNDDTAIKLENVSKDFLLPHQKANSVKSLFTGLMRGGSGKAERQHALRDISFEVKKGEFFGIVGRNGSGKSTLLKIIAEIYRPTKGAVTKSGRLVPFIELGVGFNPELTGRENVYLNGALLGFSTREIDEQYDDIVQFAELEQFMDQKLKNYSSGMQVRLAFSVATRAKAEILLIDEVLAVGDADFQRKCFNYFKSLKKSGTTVIFVSHDMEAVREYCDRAVLIEKSKIIEVGETDIVAQKYTKLFTENLESSQMVGQEGGRWGKGDLIVENVKANVNDKSIEIQYFMKSNQIVKAPIAGLRIRSTSGDHITGTNTKIEKYKIGTIQDNEEKMITWVIPNILSDGEYFIDTAIHSADGITVLDWWDEAAAFSVKKDRTLPYAIDPGFSVK
jgi:ABC-2 type transport system ATP-binding protein